MFELKSFQFFFTVFFLFGLSPFISISRPKRTIELIISYFPRLILLFSVIFMVYHFYCQLLIARNIVMCYFAMTISVYAAIIECVYLSNSFHVTPQKIAVTIQSLEKLLQIQCPVEKMQRSIRFKFTLQFIIILSGLVLKYFIPSKNGVTWLEDVALTMAFLYRCIHLLHTTIYVDIIQDALICLCRFVELEAHKCKFSDRNSQQNIDACSRVMSQIKLIHFKLWYITQCVNKQFGWFLTTFPIDTMSTVTYSFYWTFIILKLPRYYHINVSRKTLFQWFFDIFSEILYTKFLFLKTKSFLKKKIILVGIRWVNVRGAIW